MSAPNSTIILFKNTNLRDSVGDYNTVYFSTADKFKAWLLEGNNNPSTAPRYAKEFTNQMYTREGDGAVRVQAHMSELYGVDYMYYKNEGEKYDNITYFCFVDKIEYVNDNVTRVYFHEDTWQTWIRACDVKQGICDRKIVPINSNSEEVIDSTELYDVPDYTANASLKLYHSTPLLYNEANGTWVIIGVTRKIKADFTVDEDAITYIDVNGGRPDTVFYYVVKLNSTFVYNFLFVRCLMRWADTSAGLADWTKYQIVFFSAIPENALPAYIVNNCAHESTIGLIGPNLAEGTSSITYHKTVSNSDVINHTYAQYEARYEGYITADEQFITQEELNTGAFGGYTPKNRKMKAFPYVTYRLRNHWGAYIDLNPFHITWYYHQGDDPARTGARFVAKALLAAASGTNCYVDYEGIEENPNVRVSTPPMPIIPYSDDTEARWLENNKFAVAATLATGAVGAVGGIAGGAAGFAVGKAASNASWAATVNTAASGGSTRDMTQAAQEAGAAVRNSTPARLASMSPNPNANGMLETMNGMQSASANAPSRGGDPSGFAPLCEHLNAFAVDTLTIPIEVAKHIDDMFSMYGYKIGTMDKFEWQGVLSKYVENVFIGRQYWTYYKTLDAHVTEDSASTPVPAYAKRRIEDILNGGIRVWRSGHMYNYGDNNNTPPTDTFND